MAQAELFEQILKTPEMITLPERWTPVEHEEGFCFAHINVEIQIDRYDRLPRKGPCKVFFNKKETNIQRQVYDQEGLESLIHHVHALDLCPGCEDGSRPSSCHGYLEDKVGKCQYCKAETKRRAKAERRRWIQKLAKTKKMKARSAQQSRLQKKVRINEQFQVKLYTW